MLRLITVTISYPFPFLYLSWPYADAPFTKTQTKFFSSRKNNPSWKQLLWLPDFVFGSKNITSARKPLPHFLYSHALFTHLSQKFVDLIYLPRNFVCWMVLSSFHENLKNIWGMTPDKLRRVMDVNALYSLYVRQLLFHQSVLSRISQESSQGLFYCWLGWSNPPFCF